MQKAKAQETVATRVIGSASIQDCTRIQRIGDFGINGRDQALTLSDRDDECNGDVTPTFPKHPLKLRYVDLPKVLVMALSMHAAACAVKSPLGLSAKLLTALIRPIFPS
jgi:hypothetical protein